jgi:Fic family protein
MPIDTATLGITPEILSLVAQIDEFKGAWRALSVQAPQRLAALRRVATIESIGSSTRIEGARLSDREVEALLSRLDTQSFRSRDEEEVAGYAEAMERVFISYADIPLTENTIKQLHGMLLRHSGKDERHRGQYKTLPNHVEAFDADGKSLGIVFETATPFDTPRRMQELVEWTQAALADAALHPLLVIGVFTVVFLAIHPFQDGNGRLSRILTTLLLLKPGYGYVPYSSLESVIEANKEGYYLALRRTQRTLAEALPEWEPWLLFFLRALQRQKARLAEKIAGEKLMSAAVPALAQAILDLARDHGRIGIGDIIRVTGQNRSTIKLRLGELVRGGQLARHGKGRATWYTPA